MKEYIKNNNALLSLIPNLHIVNALPADALEDELAFVPDAGVYKWTNGQWSQIMQVSGGSGTDSFIGEIVPYYGATAADRSSSGWLLCDGSTYNYNDYPDLALLIDDTLVPGSTFQVPDLREKYPTMTGTNGDNTFNADTYTLGQTKTPSVEYHTHALTETAHDHPNAALFQHSHTYTGGTAYQVFNSQYTFPSGNNYFTASTTSTSIKTQATNSANVSYSIGAVQSTDLQLTMSTYGSGKTQPKTVCCYYYIRAL